MSITHTHAVTLACAGESLGSGYPVSQSCEGEINRDWSIGTNTTISLNAGCDVELIKSFDFRSNLAVTLRGVDGSATVNVSVAADKPLIWYTELGADGSGQPGLSFPFIALTNGDVTFTVINSSTVSTGSGTLRIGGNFVT